MGWNVECSYRVCATYYQEGDAQLLLFDLEDAEPQQGRTTSPLMSDEGFGPDAETVRRMKKADADTYANGRGIEKEAILAPNGNDITQEALDDYFVAAENIMEKIRG